MISSRNFGIRKREVIDHIKSAVEVACPGQVSCADIIALAARESVALSGGPHIAIPLGRKDSRTSSSGTADARLPSPGISVDEFLQIFSSKGMSVEESVAILGNGLPQTFRSNISKLKRRLPVLRRRVTRVHSCRCAYARGGTLHQHSRPTLQPEPRRSLLELCLRSGTLARVSDQESPQQPDAGVQRPDPDHI